MDSNSNQQEGIVYPYMPEGRTILFVSESNLFMIEAKNYALENSLDRDMPNASIIVKDGIVIGKGANGSDYHEKNGCERKRLGSKTGEDYELCEGCHPKNHGERRAIEDANKMGNDTDGADIYMWGHWWCCKPCWDSIIEAGILNVYVVEGAKEKFDKRK